MPNITDVKDYTVTGEYDIDASFKTDGESSKHVTLRFVMNNVPLKDIITKALATARITWANGPGRSKYHTWKDRSVVRVDFSSPAKQVKSREEIYNETYETFRKAGVPEAQAHEYATKVLDNPEVIA